VTAKTEKGLLSAAKATNRVKPILMNEKKAALIVDKFKGNTLEELAKENATTIRNANGVTLKSPTLVGAGSEPKVVGAMFNAESNKVYKNMFEEDFFVDQLQRLGKGDSKYSYTKITNIDFGRKVINRIPNMKVNKINVIVYNFVDMLSHARTDMKVIKELADDDAAYRSLTASWFEHSPLLDIMKQISKLKHKVIYNYI
jgi:hypothetical protein